MTVLKNQVKWWFSKNREGILLLKKKKYTFETIAKNECINHIIYTLLFFLQFELKFILFVFFFFPSVLSP